ncbi:MAG TPA: DUF1080 domain-containing protein [Acidobacteriota bacterium]|nr:DUF1080 domain-containing protein [Acidobacteriota bacterium]
MAGVESQSSFTGGKKMEGFLGEIRQQKGRSGHCRFRPGRSDWRRKKLAAKGSVLLAVVALCLFGCSGDQGNSSAEEIRSTSEEIIVDEPPEGEGWKPLFDGRALGGWEITQFGGEGKVEVASGYILLEMGNDLTGITWSGDFPTDSFEIVVEAQRARGSDFFCGLTFPVGEEFCTLIVGGWGGALVGLSSIDGRDASENDTRTYLNFENGRWYSVRLQVVPERIAAWIDGEKVVETERADQKFTVRPEVRLSRPLGIATWRTSALIRSIWYRNLSEQQ